MEELLTTFHIDWKLLTAQLVNFVIVFLVLWRFALKPLMKTMAERSTAIDQSLQDAEVIEKKLVATNADVAEKIREAKHQATAIIEQSKKQAEEKRNEILVDAKRDVEKIITQARLQIQQEKDAAVQDAKNKLVDVVASGMAKILGDELSPALDRKVIKDRLSKLK